MMVEPPEQYQTSSAAELSPKVLNLVIYFHQSHFLLQKLHSDYISDLIMMSDSLETFLLCSAALANLTSMVPSSLTCVSSSNMVYILMSHPASSATSVYILEQLVTIFVNLGMYL